MDVGGLGAQYSYLALQRKNGGGDVSRWGGGGGQQDPSSVHQLPDPKT
jgi:hypothetical protein